MTEKSNVLKSAGVMGFAVFLSRILGLVREQVFAALFGASHATDAFQIAFRIPNLLRDLFAEGALSAALVPTFVKVQNDEGPARAWQVATRVFGVLFVMVTLIAGVGILFSESLVQLYASAYREVPGKFELTVRMTQIMMPFFPLVALAAAFMAILNAMGKFFVPSFASAMFNLVSVSVGIVCAQLLPHYGFEPIEGMAFGVVAGGFVQAAIQWPLLKRVGYQVNWKQPFQKSFYEDPALRRMMFLMIPGTVGLAATQINILVNSIFATEVGAGAVSWLNYAFRLMQFPIGIFGVSLASATLPAFSRSWAKLEWSDAGETLVKSMNRVFAVNFPASVGLAFLGVPIIGLIFEHGLFSVQDTQATAAALAAYTLGLTGYSVVKVLVPICYAIGETRLAVASSFFAVISNLVFNFLFVKELGFVGLALGTSITAILNALLLWMWVSRSFRRQGHRLQAGIVLKALIRYLAVALAMGAVVFYMDQFLVKNAFFQISQHYGVRVLVGVGLGASVYGLLCIFFKCEETLEMLELFKRRLNRRR
jgi:putative peptidoglycan lipid II flippase